MGEQRTGGLVVGRDEVLLVDAGMLKPVIGCTIVAVFFSFFFIIADGRWCSRPPTIWLVFNDVMYFSVFSCHILPRTSQLIKRSTYQIGQIPPQMPLVR